MPLEGSTIEVLDPPFTTIDAYLTWSRARPPEQHYEVVDGQPIVTPSPTVRHQWVVASLLRRLSDACPQDHVVLSAPLDWLLWEAPRLHLRQPDLVVVSRAVIDAPRLSAAPLLVIEILSRTSLERDLVAKREAYSRAGLAHYWVVDPDQPQIVVYRRGAESLEITARASGDERLSVDEPFEVTLTPRELLD